MQWLRFSDDITSWVHYHYQKIIPLLSFLDLSKEDDSDECEAALIGRRIPLTMSLHQKNSLAALISQIIYLTALNDDIIPLTAFIYLIIPLTAPIHRTPTLLLQSSTIQPTPSQNSSCPKRLIRPLLHFLYHHETKEAS